MKPSHHQNIKNKLLILLSWNVCIISFWGYWLRQTAMFSWGVYRAGCFVYIHCFFLVWISSSNLSWYRLDISGGRDSHEIPPHWRGVVDVPAGHQESIFHVMSDMSCHLLSWLPVVSPLCPRRPCEDLRRLTRAILLGPRQLRQLWPKPRQICRNGHRYAMALRMKKS